MDNESRLKDIDDSITELFRRSETVLNILEKCIDIIEQQALIIKELEDHRYKHFPKEVNL